VKVPNGFAITAEAYMHMLNQAGAMEKLHAALDDLDPENVYDLAHRGAEARRIVYNAGIPDDLKEEILAALRRTPGRVW
jgi:pyruvate,water dikinase